MFLDDEEFGLGKHHFMVNELAEHISDNQDAVTLGNFFKRIRDAS